MAKPTTNVVYPVQVSKGNTLYIEAHGSFLTKKNIQRQLKNLGYKFKTHSDTEVVIKSFHYNKTFQHLQMPESYLKQNQHKNLFLLPQKPQHNQDYQQYQ